MTNRPLARGEQISLVAFFCAAVAAFGASYQQPGIWIFWIPALLSLFWRFGRVPLSLRKIAEYISWLLLVLIIAVGLNHISASSLLSPSVEKAAILIGGFGLAAACSLFLIGSAVWSIPICLIPAALGVLVCAAFNVSAKVTPLYVGAGMALVMYLLLSKRTAHGLRDLLNVRLAASIVASAVVSAALFFGQPRLQRSFDAATMKWIVGSGSEANPLATQSRLGDLAELQLSTRVVMRVWTPQPQYLRGRVFARFSGNSWQLKVGRSAPLRKQLGSLAPGLENVPGSEFTPLPASDAKSHVVPTVVYQAVTSPGVLVAPQQTIVVRAPVDMVSADRNGLLSIPLSATVTMYGIENATDVPTAEGSADPEYTALPADLDPRWRPLAERLMSESAPADRVAHTIDYVKHAASYSLKIGEFHTRDPLAEFFFEKRRGYCQYFASAAIVLLRLQGVPARYVTGYTVQEFNKPGGYYVVRDADAHAWLEAFEPRKGWVQADPTPEGEFEARRETGDTNWVSQSVEWLAALAAEAKLRVSNGDWRGAAAALWKNIKSFARAIRWNGAVFLMVVLAAVVVLWIARRALRSRLPHRKLLSDEADIPQPLRHYLDRLNSTWDRLGVPRPPSRALLEHTQEIGGKVPPELQKLSREFVDEYYAASFSGIDVRQEELKTLDRLAGELEAAVRLSSK